MNKIENLKPGDLLLMGNKVGVVLYVEDDHDPSSLAFPKNVTILMFKKAKNKAATIEINNHDGILDLINHASPDRWKLLCRVKKNQTKKLCA